MRGKAWALSFFLSCSKWSYFLYVIGGKPVLRRTLLMKRFPFVAASLLAWRSGRSMGVQLIQRDLHPRQWKPGSSRNSAEGQADTRLCACPGEEPRC